MVLELLIYIFLAAIFVEGITELVVKSAIFEPVREKILSRGGFFSQLLSCGYCTSVWLSVPSAVVLSFIFADMFLGFVILSIAFIVILHRLSNYIHNINDKHFDKFYDKHYGKEG